MASGLFLIFLHDAAFTKFNIIPGPEGAAVKIPFKGGWRSSEARSWGRSDLKPEDDLVTEGTMSGLQKSLILLLVGLCGMSAASYFSTGSPFTVLQVLF